MNKHIIIIGGMGPQASVELHRRILARAVMLGARNGADFPSITHVSLPIDDFINDEDKPARAFEMIKMSMERLYLWRGCPDGYCV